MRILLLIGTGSFIGGIFRYLLSQLLQSKFLSAFPFGTLGVNITGCFLIGLVFGLSDRGNLTQEWRLFLATGICGGFTNGLRGATGPSRGGSCGVVRAGRILVGGATGAPPAIFC